MRFVVLDLEWNQPFSSEQTVQFNGVGITGEIIQIGAVRLDENDRPTDTFDCLVKPQHYTRMHWKVQKLTGITSKLIGEKGVPLSDAVRDFLAFCGEDCAVLTWGTDDYPMLLSNLKMAGIPIDRLPPFYDLQKIYGRAILHERKQTALTTALESFGLSAVEPQHNGLNDALSTSLLCDRIHPAEAISKYDIKPADALSLRLPWSVRKYTGYQAMRTSLLAKTSIPCPECGETVFFNEWITPGRGKRIYLANCAGEHYFALRIQIRKMPEDEIFTVSRSLRRITKAEADELTERYPFPPKNTPKRAVEVSDNDPS